jgi:hypothetical protein
MINDTTEDLKLVADNIKKLRAECATRVAGGGCSSFEVYQSVTGRIKGYDDCLKIIGETLKSIQTRD